MTKCKCGEPVSTKGKLCRECHRKYMKEWRKKKKLEGSPTHEVYNYAWRSKNPEAYLLHNSKSRAKKKGLDFNIDREDIIIPDRCPVLGMPISLVYGEGVKDNKPSLDRVDSSKGYVKGNVQVISWRANNLKSDGTLDEFKKLVEFLENA